jgi:hypothetical protein
MVLLVGGTALVGLLVGMELAKARRLDAAFFPRSIWSFWLAERPCFACWLVWNW